MKHFLLAVPLLIVSIQLQAAEEQKREMWDEPSHQLVFERENTRILDVRIVPGVTSEYHSHHFATVYIVIQDALMQNKDFGQSWSAKADRPYRSPGSIVDRSDYLLENTYHRVRNYDDRTFQLIAIVNSAMSGAGAPTVLAENGSPLDNHWFAAHRVLLAPGATSEYLHFANQVVLVRFDTGSTHLLEKGVVHGVSNRPGAWSWHAAGSTFQVVNDDDKPHEIILIEVKRG